MKDKIIKFLCVLVGLGLGFFIVWIFELILNDIDKFLTKPDTELTTSDDRLTECMLGSTDMLFYYKGKLYDCKPDISHKRVTLYLKGD